MSNEMIDEEVETLEAIFMDEMEIISENPRKISILVVPSDEEASG